MIVTIPVFIFEKNPTLIIYYRLSFTRGTHSYESTYPEGTALRAAVEFRTAECGIRPPGPHGLLLWPEGPLRGARRIERPGGRPVHRSPCPGRSPSSLPHRPRGHDHQRAAP